HPPPANASGDDPAVIRYSGGTTDLPKAVMLSHRSLPANIMVQTRHRFSAAAEGRERTLVVVPFIHAKAC
ncbi:MAG TPA: dicarboxylate--CoA ligase PimA, partial [Chloroflexi bacterium]|nr:dicarboxylate--CoA ligase PimA [Chloroflexota bacterium]